MDEETYLNLLSLVTPLIEKNDMVMRNAISPHERLTATGKSYEDLKFLTVLSPHALSNIISETYDAIYEVIFKDYLTVKKTKSKNV